MVYKLLSPIYWGVSVLRNTYFYFRENQRPIKSKNFFFLLTKVNYINSFIYTQKLSTLKQAFTLYSYVSINTSSSAKVLFNKESLLSSADFTKQVFTYIIHIYTYKIKKKYNFCFIFKVFSILL